MRRLISKLMIVAAIIGAFSLPVTQTVYASAKDDVCAGVGLTGGSCDPAGSSKSISDIIALVINVLSILVGVVAVIVIIFAGLRYITAAGDSSKISSAKDTLLYAIIGLVIASLAQIIVRFVLAKL